MSLDGLKTKIAAYIGVNDKRKISQISDTIYQAIQIKATIPEHSLFLVDLLLYYPYPQYIIKEQIESILENSSSRDDVVSSIALATISSLSSPAVFLKIIKNNKSVDFVITKAIIYIFYEKKMRYCIDNILNYKPKSMLSEILRIHILILLFLLNNDQEPKDTIIKNIDIQIQNSTEKIYHFIDHEPLSIASMTSMMQLGSIIYLLNKVGSEMVDELIYIRKNYINKYRDNKFFLQFMQNSEEIYYFLGK